MLNIPDSVLNELAGKENILLVGAGGAFDVLATLPIYYSLVNQFDVNVELANYSFVHFSDVDALNAVEGFEPNIKGATSGIKSYTNHFPEAYIASYFKEGFSQDRTVWMFNNRQTIHELHRSYESFCKHKKIDAIIACGFGLRSIMQGNEEKCGNMIHSTINLGALSFLPDIPKILFTIGHESNPDKGVSLNSVLENIAAINKQNGYLGGLMIEKNMASYSFMKSAFEWVIKQPEHESNELLESVLIGIEGGFGPHDKSQTQVTPLMSHAHFFDLDIAVGFNKIFPLIESAKDYGTTIQDGMSLINNNNQRESFFLSI